MGECLVTEVAKEAPIRMKISHCIKLFTGFFQEIDPIFRHAFPSSYSDPDRLPP